jgi:hypothetical protein
MAYRSKTVGDTPTLSAAAVFRNGLRPFMSLSARLQRARVASALDLESIGQ